MDKSSGREKRARGGKSETASRSQTPTSHKVLQDGLTIVDEAAVKYSRGPLTVNTRKLPHKRLRKTIQEEQEVIINSAARNASTEILLTQDAGFIEAESHAEKVYKLTQRDIVEQVDMNSAKNVFDLQLTTFGPYRVNYSRNGRHMIFGGRGGHVATMDCLRTSIGAELQLREDVHDVHYLHNETLFAAAQEKYTYIYDHKGVEIHCLRDHERTYRLGFLPYHYLLTTVGHSGWVKWHDVSIGSYVAGFQSGHGPCKVLKQNPHNAVTHLGHSNGVVSLWSPSAGKALVSMFCHKSPVTDLAIDRSGMHMATAGLDGFLKIWDLRTYRCLHTYRPDHPAMSLDISDRGMLAIAIGRSVQVLSGAFTHPSATTFVKHNIRASNPALSSGGGAVAATKALASSIAVHSVKFRPFEDVLVAGHTHGVTTMIVPGSGEPNFDSFESNPFMNPKQRREGEIQSLLQKLQPDMISLDPSFIGTVDKDSKTLAEEQQDLFRVANHKTPPAEKNKMRGKNKISAKLRRKQKNVVDAQSVKLREKLKQQKEEDEARKQGVKKQAAGFDPLSRFARK